MALEPADVVKVLPARVVPSVKLALQPERDAGHWSFADDSHDHVGCRIGERDTVEACCNRHHRRRTRSSEGRPSVGATGRRQTLGEPVGLGRESQRLKTPRVTSKTCQRQRAPLESIEGTEHVATSHER